VRLQEAAAVAGGDVWFAVEDEDAPLHAQARHLIRGGREEHAAARPGGRDLLLGEGHLMPRRWRRPRRR
jgi:hypothetical protein